jgi:hypothetical protein
MSLRSAQMRTLRELGTSLADVAAFMHETEVREGLETRGEDRRGIGRLRFLALRMHNSPERSQVSSRKVYE